MTTERSYSLKAYEKQRGRARSARRQRAKKQAPPVPQGEVCDWIEKILIVPTGPLTGHPFRLGEWQRQFVEGALQPGIRESGLSVARKNGKSGLVAAVVLSHLIGPARRTNWRGVIVSLTGKLAAELMQAIELTAAASGFEEAITIRKYPPPGLILGPDGCQVDVLASDKASGHAIGSDLAIIDEAGLLEERSRPLWNAMLSSVSGRDGRLMAISVQGDGPMFREMQDRKDTRAVYWQEHSADPDCALDDRDAWAAANPGLQDGIKSVSYMEDAAERALHSPADQGSFRLYDLNTPGAGLQTTLVSVSDWQACLVEQLPEAEGPLVLGLDLGGSSSMCCAVAYWPHTHRMQAWGAFGGLPHLNARGRQDGVGGRYEMMEARGELTVYPGRRTTPIDEFLPDVLDRLQGYKISRIIADQYRQAEAQDEFDKAGIKARREFRRPAVKEGATDVLAFQKAVLDGRIKCQESLMISQAIRDSRLSRDKWGNLTLDKSRQNGRIDVLSAAVMAVGVGVLIKERKRTPVRLYKA